MVLRQATKTKRISETKMAVCKSCMARFAFLASKTDVQCVVCGSEELWIREDRKR